MNAIRTFTSPETAIAAYVDRKRREIALIASECRTRRRSQLHPRRVTDPG